MKSMETGRQDGGSDKNHAPFSVGKTGNISRKFLTIILKIFDKNFERLQEESKYFTGYLSDRKLTDIDEKYVDSCITVDDMTKLSRQLDVSMGSMFQMINVFAVLLAVLLIYLLAKLILERNTTSISMVKILGYENKEIARLYLLATSWVVALSTLVGFAIATLFMTVIYKAIMMEFNGWLTLYYSPDIYPKMFVMIMVSYAVVAATQYHKIQKIPMDEALKNVE